VGEVALPLHQAVPSPLPTSVSASLLARLARKESQTSVDKLKVYLQGSSPMLSAHEVQLMLSCNYLDVPAR